MYMYHVYRHDIHIQDASGLSTEASGILIGKWRTLWYLISGIVLCEPFVYAYGFDLIRILY